MPAPRLHPILSCLSHLWYHGYSSLPSWKTDLGRAGRFPVGQSAYAYPVHLGNKNRERCWKATLFLTFFLSSLIPATSYEMVNINCIHIVSLCDILLRDLHSRFFCLLFAGKRLHVSSTESIILRIESPAALPLDSTPFPDGPGRPQKHQVVDVRHQVDELGVGAAGREEGKDGGLTGKVEIHT